MRGLGVTGVNNSKSTFLLPAEMQRAIVHASLQSMQLKTTTTSMRLDTFICRPRRVSSIHLLSSGHGLMRPCSASTSSSRANSVVALLCSNGTTVASLDVTAAVDKAGAQENEGNQEMDYSDTVLGSIIEILKPKDKFRYHKVPKLKALRLKLTPALVLRVLKHEEVSDIHAWKFFVWAKKQMRYKHTDETYNTILRTLCEMRKLTSIVFVLEDMYKEGMTLTPGTCLKIAKTFASSGLVERAIHALNHMNRLGNPPTTSHFNSIITVLLKSERHFKAYIAYREMSSLGCQPDAYTFKILLRDLAAVGKVDLASQVFDEMVAGGCEPDIETCSILVGVLCKAQRVDDAVAVYENLKQKVPRLGARVYNALVIGFTQTKQIDKALDIFHEMQRQGYYCDSGAFTTFTNLLVTNGREDDVQRCLSVRADGQAVRQPAKCQQIRTELLPIKEQLCI